MPSAALAGVVVALPPSAARAAVSTRSPSALPREGSSRNFTIVLLGGLPQEAHTNLVAHFHDSGEGRLPFLGDGASYPSFKECGRPADSPVVSTSMLEEHIEPTPQGSASADDEGLVEQSRARVARALGDREVLPTIATGAAFVATTIALLIWLPS